MPFTRNRNGKINNYLVNKEEVDVVAIRNEPASVKRN